MLFTPARFHALHNLLSRVREATFISFAIAVSLTPSLAQPCMAVALLSDEVSDLTLGKPPLPCLLASSSVRHALVRLKLQRDYSEISIWDCTSSSPSLPPPVGGCAAGSNPSSSIASIEDGLQAVVGGENHGLECGFAFGGPDPSFKVEWRCIGKVCMQKIICYLASDRCVTNIEKALDAPVTVLLQHEDHHTVGQVDPHGSIIDALSLIVGGAQNLVVSMSSHFQKCGRNAKENTIQKRMLASTASMPAKLQGIDHCWITQEDVLRFLTGHINVFSPLSIMSIEALGLVNTDFLMVGVEEPARSAIDKVKAACLNASAVAVVEKGNHDYLIRLVGEISCSSLERCNEAVALALVTLSAGDFLLYTQGATDCFTDISCAKLLQKLDLMQKGQLPLAKSVSGTSVLQSFEMLDESSDDDDSGGVSPKGPHDLSKRWSSMRGGHAQPTKILITCRPKSTLIAVILQALAHRQHHVWVTKEDDSLVGIVTFHDILAVILSHLQLSI